jgi:hypothetical protein
LGSIEAHRSGVWAECYTPRLSLSRPRPGPGLLSHSPTKPTGAPTSVRDGQIRRWKLPPTTFGHRPPPRCTTPWRSGTSPSTSSTTSTQQPGDDLRPRTRLLISEERAGLGGAMATATVCGRAAFNAAIHVTLPRLSTDAFSASWDIVCFSCIALFLFIEVSEVYM